MIQHRSDFAKRLGIRPGVLSIYIKRGKVVVSDAGQVDDQNEINSEFIRTHKDKMPVQSATVGGSKPAKRKPDPSIQKRNKQATQMFQLEKEQKTIDIQKKMKEQVVLDAKIRKINGELIPTQLVNLSFQQVFREMAVSLRQELDKMVTDMGQKLKLNVNQVAEMRGIILRSVNEGINKGTDASKKSVKNILSEYAQSQKG